MLSATSGSTSILSLLCANCLDLRHLAVVTAQSAAVVHSMTILPSSLRFPSIPDGVPYGSGYSGCDGFATQLLYSFRHSSRCSTDRTVEAPRSVLPSFQFPSDGGLAAVVAMLLDLGQRVFLEALLLHLPDFVVPVIDGFVPCDSAIVLPSSNLPQK